jgi:tight adherence protein C
MGEWEWFAVVAAGTAVAVVAILGLVSRGVAGDARLATKESDSGVHLILGDMTDALSKGMPGEARDRSEILPELDRAGLYGKFALAEYRAVRAVLVLAPLLAAAAVAVLVETRQQQIYVAAGGVLLALTGYSIPRVYVALRAAARHREIDRGLPVFADLVSISLLAGQGLTGALRRVVTQLRNAFPLLTEELEIVIRHTEMLNLYTAFEYWARRSQSTEVRNLAMILGQAQRLGNDVTSGLLEYATHMRSESRQKADARAQRASFWMLFPTILCLWIPATVLIIAPVYFEFANRRAKTREQIQNIAPDSPLGKAFGGKGEKNGDGEGGAKAPQAGQKGFKGK